MGTASSGKGPAGEDDRASSVNSSSLSNSSSPGWNCAPLSIPLATSDLPVLPPSYGHPRGAVPWVSLRFAYQQHPLEAVMGGLEPVTKIEAMSIGTHLIARQLNAVTTSLSDPIDREFEQLTADTLGPEIRVDVEGLDLGAQTALGLEVTEHDHLADTH